MKMCKGYILLKLVNILNIGFVHESKYERQQENISTLLLNLPEKFKL